MSKPSCYIGGPMRGYPEFNFAAFDEAEALLTALGWRVKSPAAHDDAMGFDRTRDLEDQPGMKGGRFDLKVAFVWDVTQISKTDAIVLLPGWQASSGASVELAVARLFGNKCFEYDPTLPPEMGCLRELTDA